MLKMRVFSLRHMTWGLGLAGLLAMASGCEEPNPATSVAPEEAKAQGEAQRAAREKAFGPGGANTGQKPKSSPAPAKKAETPPAEATPKK